ncbi:hypothetical protein KO465_07680 [Candidatus Micrarchaeota archaeon]|jgi:hypothetical protein|nr:hypothetical protein [Candidatus Micrarchaeota archaeon]
MSKLLIDDKPVMVLPKLAKAIGLNEAIVLQQIHYWLITYKEAGKQDHFADGCWWVYNTKQEWSENFPWWSENTAWRALTNLREIGLVKTTSQYNKKGYDRTLWYSIDYRELQRIEDDEGKSILPKWENAFYQNDKMDLTKMGTPIPETTPETNYKDIKLTGDLFDDCKVIFETLKGNLIGAPNKFSQMISTFKKNGVIAKDYYESIIDQDASGKYPRANSPTSYMNWTLTHADRRINPPKIQNSKKFPTRTQTYIDADGNKVEMEV